MKRYGYLYSKIYDMENLILAHKNASRNKSWYKEVKEINRNKEYYLKQLQQSLIDKTYKTSDYETFIRNDGTKEREIFKLPYYPDRICQWAILQVIEPILLKKFTKDTYSSIPNRGIHSCYSEALKTLKDEENCKYCLKLDVKKFYPSIDREILKGIYRKVFKDDDLLWLLDEIINSADGDKGVPIGNYLSQYSGNLYLSEFDHWIKEEKRVKYYFRYMDDMVILSNDKNYLHSLRVDIQDYLNTRLNLTLKSNYQVFPTFTRGLDFVGYRFFKDYILLRKSTCKKFKEKMLKIKLKIERGKELNYTDYCAVQSYKGWLKWCNSYRLQQKYLEPLQSAIDSYYETKLKKGAKDDITRKG